MRLRATVLASAFAAVTILGGAATAVADDGVQGVAKNSPGVLSGNVVQIPVKVPINVCGNTVSVIGALNPAAGNTCVNE